MHILDCCMLLILPFLRWFTYKHLSSAYYEVLQALGVAGVKAVTKKKAAFVHADMELVAEDQGTLPLGFVSATLRVFGRLLSLSLLWNSEPVMRMIIILFFPLHSSFPPYGIILPHPVLPLELEHDSSLMQPSVDHTKSVSFPRPFWEWPWKYLLEGGMASPSQTFRIFTHKRET